MLQIAGRLSSFEIPSLNSAAFGNASFRIIRTGIRITLGVRPTGYALTLDIVARAHARAIELVVEELHDAVLAVVHHVGVQVLQLVRAEHAVRRVFVELDDGALLHNREVNGPACVHEDRPPYPAGKEKACSRFPSGTGCWCVTNETRSDGSANTEPICPCGHIEYH